MSDCCLCVCDVHRRVDVCTGLVEVDLLLATTRIDGEFIMAEVPMCRPCSGWWGREHASRVVAITPRTEAT